MGEFVAEKLFFFILFALPGAIAIRVYALLCPVPQKDWKDSIVDAVMYSTFGLGIWMMFFPNMVKAFVGELLPKEGMDYTTQVVNAVFDNRVALLFYILVTPTLQSFFWHKLRYHVLHQWLKFDHPTRTAWDWAFSRKEPVYILFLLKAKDPVDDSPVIIVGFFGSKSFVSAYPHDPEVFVESVHVLFEGGVGIRIPDSKGMLIKLSECERLEFLMKDKPPPVARWRRCKNFIEDIPRRVRKWRTKEKPESTPDAEADTLLIHKGMVGSGTTDDVNFFLKRPAGWYSTYAPNRKKKTTDAPPADLGELPNEFIAVCEAQGITITEGLLQASTDPIRFCLTLFINKAGEEPRAGGSELRAAIREFLEAKEVTVKDDPVITAMWDAIKDVLSKRPKPPATA